jgi:hypothetical protein
MINMVDIVSQNLYGCLRVRSGAHTLYSTWRARIYKVDIKTVFV